MRVKLKEAALLKAMLFFLSKTLSLCYLCIQFFGSDFFEPFIDDSADFMGQGVRISSISACLRCLLAAASSFPRKTSLRPFLDLHMPKKNTFHACSNCYNAKKIDSFEQENLCKPRLPQPSAARRACASHSPSRATQAAASNAAPAPTRSAAAVPRRPQLTAAAARNEATAAARSASPAAPAAERRSQPEETRRQQLVAVRQPQPIAPRLPQPDAGPSCLQLSARRALASP